MPSQIFSIVEVNSKNDTYVIINGQWWVVEYDPGSPPNHSQEISISDPGQEECYYVWPVETRKMSDVTIESYRLQVSMADADDTDYVERDIAKYVLLEETEHNELLELKRID